MATRLAKLGAKIIRTKLGAKIIRNRSKFWFEIGNWTSEIWS